LFKAKEFQEGRELLFEIVSNLPLTSFCASSQTKHLLGTSASTSPTYEFVVIFLPCECTTTLDHPQKLTPFLFSSTQNPSEKPLKKTRGYFETDRWS
jgi:hypothetical protein